MRQKTRLVAPRKAQCSHIPQTC